jgi:hypothetical protein
MNIIGGVVWGLTKKVLARLVARQRCMGKKKWSDGIDVRRLSGEEWFRLLTGETNMAAFTGWCARCRTGKCRETTCLHCGEALLLFDEQFWLQIGHKIRLALQKDRTLLSRVKSERESLYGTKHKPTFPPRLEWFMNSWEQAPRPSHRSFDPKAHYLAANSVESLRRLGLSKEEIIDVLRTDDFPDGQFERHGKDYAAIPGKELRKLGEGIRRAVEDIPGSALDLSEMGRTMAWVDRQRTVPMARLQGERVRKMNPARVRSGRELGKT